MSSREQLRQASLTGAAKALEDVTYRDPGKMLDLRATWPELADKLDALCSRLIVDPAEGLRIRP